MAPVLGLRCETTPEQMRFILAKLRELVLSHPRLSHEGMRVRFIGYGDYSKNVVLRAFVKTKDWNDFYAVQEDVLLRVEDIVVEAGSGFAFPSSTVYLGRDRGLDDDQAQAAQGGVRGWRERGNLPYPDYRKDEAEAMSNTLDYPPEGSPGHEGGRGDR